MTPREMDAVFPQVADDPPAVVELVGWSEGRLSLVPGTAAIQLLLRAESALREAHAACLFAGWDGDSVQSSLDEAVELVRVVQREVR